MDIRLLIFDLDGTLIDSKLDLAHAVNATRAFLRLGPINPETIYTYVGNGAPTLIRRAIGPDFDDAQLAAALEFFLIYYRAHALENTRFYPGVREALNSFGDRILAVLTNKPVRISGDILEALGVAAKFRYVFGGNSFETKKPHPEGVQFMLHDSGVGPPQAMIVGDSAVDVLTGRNAGIYTCGVTYGFSPHSFEENPPDLLVSDLGQLAALLEVRSSSPRTPQLAEPTTDVEPFACYRKEKGKKTRQDSKNTKFAKAASRLLK